VEFARRLQMTELEMQERQMQERHEQEAADAFVAATAAAEERQRLEQQREWRADRLSQEQLWSHSSTQRRRTSESQQLCARAATLRADLFWFSALDLVLSALLIAPLGGFGAMGTAAPLLGLASAALYDWKLACLHVLSAAANTAVRAVFVPFSTSNFLWAAGSIALATSCVHLVMLGVSWASLLWSHGSQVKGGNASRRSQQQQQRTQSRFTHTHGTQRVQRMSINGMLEVELSEGVPISHSAAEANGVATGLPVHPGQPVAVPAPVPVVPAHFM